MSFSCRIKGINIPKDVVSPTLRGKVILDDLFHVLRIVFAGLRLSQENACQPSSCISLACSCNDKIRVPLAGRGASAALERKGRESFAQPLERNRRWRDCRVRACGRLCIYRAPGMDFRESATCFKQMVDGAHAHRERLHAYVHKCGLRISPLRFPQSFKKTFCQDLCPSFPQNLLNLMQKHHWNKVWGWWSLVIRRGHWGKMFPFWMPTSDHGVKDTWRQRV